MSTLPHPDDTIAALASAPGPALRGIVRVTGPRALESVAGMCLASADFRDNAILQTPRSAVCVRQLLRLVGVRQPLAADICVWPGRRSYTRQPLAELHLPGSPPLLEAVLETLYSRGVRAALPGEFTLRAFLAGRIDLLQAEAVLGVIDAAGPIELRRALEQLGGGVSARMVRLRGDLLDLLADLEAGLDFADEAIEFVSHAMLVGRLGLARQGLAQIFESAHGRLRPAGRLSVVLAGPPNVGKSTLFNALCGAQAAIVSSQHGTTRDYLTAEIDIAGVPVRLTDTAGEESDADGIMEEAQKRRRELVAQADLVIWCRSAETLSANDREKHSSHRLPVVTKADLLARPLDVAAIAQPVSVHRNFGLDELRGKIAARLAARPADEAGLLATSAARCRDSLRQAVAAIDRAVAIAGDEADQELLAIELREALEELGVIVGAVYTDDVLDRIFSKFCIGK